MYPERVAYCPSKAAVEMLTRCLAVDCGPRVRVNGILPGLTETPMTKMRYENAPDPEAERQKTRNRYILEADVYAGGRGEWRGIPCL